MFAFRQNRGFWAKTHGGHSGQRSVEQERLLKRVNLGLTSLSESNPKRTPQTYGVWEGVGVGCLSDKPLFMFLSWGAAQIWHDSFGECWFCRVLGPWNTTKVGVSQPLGRKKSEDEGGGNHCDQKWCRAFENAVLMLHNKHTLVLNANRWSSRRGLPRQFGRDFAHMLRQHGDFLSNFLFKNCLFLDTRLERYKKYKGPEIEHYSIVLWMYTDMFISLLERSLLLTHEFTGMISLLRRSLIMGCMVLTIPRWIDTSGTMQCLITPHRETEWCFHCSLLPCERWPEKVPSCLHCSMLAASSASQQKG